tara:strand:- start:1244 stop:2755 length:1512 start_codon:yes stop_codon:yes gene_type:complete
MKMLGICPMLAMLLWVLGLTVESQAQTLSWAPPELVNPITVNVTSSYRSLNLDTNQDYIIQMPTTPLTANGGLNIIGGHNVVLIGGEIRFDTPLPDGFHPTARRGLFVKQSTGTVHIEGLLITGDYLLEGINIDMRDPNAVLQLQNIRIDTVTGSYDGNHADCVQTWGGPSELRIDRMTGRTTYQGFFLHPEQFADTTPILFDMRNINIIGLPGAAYLYWQATDYPLVTQNCWASPDADSPWPTGVLWPKNDPVWGDVQQGVPPTGDFVTTNVGINYVSPGYQGTSAFAYDDFNSITGLNLQGSSMQSIDDTLVLTWGDRQGASAWQNEKQPVANGFETMFEFCITDQHNGGADGFALVIQNDSNTVLGAGSYRLGYGHDIYNSLAIEFDTWLDTSVSDPNDNHVSIHTRGALLNSPDESCSIASATPSVNLSDGQVHLVDVLYEDGTLYVFIDDMNTPVIEVDYDLENLGLDAGKAWIGFTAGTGWRYQTQEILSWYFMGYE